MLDLPATLPDDERYTYVFEGNSQVLDHILISPAIATRGFAYDVVHVTRSSPIKQATTSRRSPGSS
jgi:uncharacterized protein